jgi:uncharacterized protein YndB with AHSA1/START domain
MDAARRSESPKNPTTAERKSDLELVIRRTFDAPARLVFEAWTKAELFKRWWVPKSFNMLLHSVEMDVRVGGKYRVVFDDKGSPGMAFFGQYLEVVPNARLSWTNEEGGPNGPVTTVVFEEKGGKTLVTMTEKHSSKQSLDDNLGASEGMQETFAQLDEVLASL